ncbi:MAG TPA: hypothetical protein PLU27_12965 [Ginsengibacter sp.]|nr:hypothetical protein [Ginsengibacter sp.]
MKYRKIKNSGIVLDFKISVVLRESSVVLRVTKNYYTEKKTEKARRTTEKIVVGQETNHQEGENSVNLSASSVPLRVTKNITQRKDREYTENHRESHGRSGDQPLIAFANLRVTKNNYTEKKTEKAQRITERVMVSLETNL